MLYDFNQFITNSLHFSPDVDASRSLVEVATNSGIMTSRLHVDCSSHIMGSDSCSSKWFNSTIG